MLPVVAGAAGGTAGGASTLSGLAAAGKGIGAGIAAIGGSVLSAGSSIWNGLTGAASAHETNETNKEIAMWNWLQNQQINRDNLNFQKESLEYQKALNEEIMNREDTAYQRTVEDMRAAGLNPLTMTGTNGSGGQVSPTEPLQMGNNQFDYQKQDEFREINFANALAAGLEAMKAYQEISMGEAQIRKTNAEARIAESDADWSDFITPIDKEYENWDRYFRLKENMHDFYWGFTPNMTDYEKGRRILEYNMNPLEYQKKEAKYENYHQDLWDATNNINGWRYRFNAGNNWKIDENIMNYYQNEGTAGGLETLGSIVEKLMKTAKENMPRQRTQRYRK